MSAGRDNKRTDDTKQEQRQLKASRAVHAGLRRVSVGGASKPNKSSEAYPTESGLRIYRGSPESAAGKVQATLQRLRRRRKDGCPQDKGTQVVIV